MKNIWKLMMMAACAFTLAACSDSDNDGPKPPVDPVENPTTSVFVLSQGNFYSGVDGDLTVFYKNTGDYVNGIFATVNERALSGTPNDGLVYGSKLYLACTDENVLEVVDAKTTTSIKQIELSGARRILADGGYLYVTSFYGSSVAKIDTTTLEVVAIAETGMYPEGLAILDGKLYVANSGYGSGNTVSVVNLANFKTEATLSVPTNPIDIFNVDGTLYLRTSGQYNADYTYAVNPALYTMDTDGTTTLLADATISGKGKEYIYFIDNNYYKTEVTYGRVKTSDNTVETINFDHGGVGYPCAVAEDPSTGDVYITSYSLIDYGGGYTGADYNSNGYCVRFDKTGIKLDQFPVGISAGAIFFY